MKGDEKMQFYQVPEWLFIIYDTHFECGDFRPTIKSGIPFATKEEAEKYATEFVNNVDDNKMLFTVIPAVQEMCIGYNPKRVSILYTGRPEISTGSVKTLQADTNKPVKWSVESSCDACISYDFNGNKIKIKCLNDAYVGETITVKAEIDDFVNTCVLTIVK